MLTSKSGAAKKRTRHACDRCRLMRIKCSGGERCHRCTKDDVVCVYGDNKRERNRKDLVESASRIRELEAENRDLVAALRRITSKGSLHESDHATVVNLLAKYAEQEQADSSQGSRSQSRSIQSPTINSYFGAEKEGENMVSSSIASPGAQGELQKRVDPDHGAGAAGFVGKMSEMSWMQRCWEYLVRESDTDFPDVEEPQLDQYSTAVVDLRYYMDDVNLLAIDEDGIDPVEWPPFDTAVITAEAYFRAAGEAFPFVGRETFLDTMYQFPRQDVMLTWAQRRWLALANLVWAVGAKWLSLAELSGPDLSEIHLVYYARARALGLDHRLLYDHPDVDVVQGIGLLAFYLFINGSISRAWNVVGNAVRHAMGLGLHLRVSDPLIGEAEQISRARTWFSLYKLQMLIAEISGRPQLIRTAHVTIPFEIMEHFFHPSIPDTIGPPHLQFSAAASKLWLGFLRHREELGWAVPTDALLPSGFSSTGGQVPHELFLYHIRLCQLSEEVADQLYTGRPDMSWSQMQSRIERLQQGLDAWLGTLPDALRLDKEMPAHQNTRAKIELALHAHSVSMMLHRPCLCKISIKNESDRSRGFNLSSARACINAAIALLDLLPGGAVAREIYQHLPWWTLLHYVCQAASVLLLELCIDAQHFQGEVGKISESIWKAMAYLSSLSESSKSAYKAWRIFDYLLQKVSVRYGDSFAVPAVQRAVPPRRWSATEESVLLSVFR